VQANQTVAEMADEVLSRQVEIRALRTGETFGAALSGVLCTEGGQQLWKLRRGEHCHERAEEWQKNLARSRAQERIQHRKPGFRLPLSVERAGLGFWTWG
jgi:hypothetical protein